MITRTHGGPLSMRSKVCRTDFDIWDMVLARRPGWRLETMSGQADRADAAAMFAACDATDTRQGMEWFNGLTDTGRGYWLNLAGSSVPAEAWAAFKRTRT